MTTTNTVELASELLRQWRRDYGPDVAFDKVADRVSAALKEVREENEYLKARIAELESRAQERISVGAGTDKPSHPSVSRH